MTMAWTAQTGLGPRTVVLSLKVFIVLMFYTHERRGICTAQPGSVLPEALQENRHQMIEYFCGSGCVWESDNLELDGLNCQHAQQLPVSLCSQICHANACNAQCWNTATSLCSGNQTQICGYSNADVCEETISGDIKRICVYTRDALPVFCICQSGSGSPYTRCDPQTTTLQATTPQATTERATTSQATTAQAATIQASAAAEPIKTADHQPKNVVGIVFGTMFAVLLLFVIVAAVVLYLHSQGRLPSFVKQASNPVGLSSVESETSSTRVLPPELPVRNSSMDYSYAQDHIPAMLGAKAEPDQDGPTYCSVGEDTHRKGNPRFVLDGQRKMPATKEPEASMGNAKGPSYFVLNRDDGGDEVGRSDGNEMTDSSTGAQATADILKEYTPLVLTGDPRSRSEPFGNEVAVSFKETTPIDSPTKRDPGTYLPLILFAEPNSPVKQSGCEDAKIPISESHNTTSLTGVQPDNTYNPLVQPVEPKSQKVCSEYEVPVINQSPGLAAGGDVTSPSQPYDHLDRKGEKRSKEGAMSSTVAHDDYQQLVNKK
ncbi:uncharacterized protein [Asterias amurensis]|uniref:uncharacterized protein n=1 Tax=Asterias amurensis TaxID=7602 RepID=UPI003AB50E3A